jgi:hypothetical protein
MGEETDEIERHIREQRHELGQNISELQRKVKDTLNWRMQFEQHPVAMLGMALGGGLLLSRILGSRHRDNPVSQTAEKPKLDSKPLAHGATSTARPVSHEKTSESWREIKAVLIAVGAMKLGNLIDSLLPGFGGDYTKAKRGNGSFSTNRP